VSERSRAVSIKLLARGRPTGRCSGLKYTEESVWLGNGVGMCVVIIFLIDEFAWCEMFDWFSGRDHVVPGES
jgi:hypothetical protein